MRLKWSLLVQPQSSLTCACGCAGLLSSFLAAFSAVDPGGRSTFCPHTLPGMLSGNCMKKSSSLPDRLSSCSSSTTDGCSGLGSSALLWALQDGGLNRGGFSRAAAWQGHTPQHNNGLLQVTHWSCTDIDLWHSALCCYTSAHFQKSPQPPPVLLLSCTHILYFSLKG